MKTVPCFIIIAGMLAAASSAWGQAGEPTVRRGDSLPEVVPAGVGFYVELDRLTDDVKPERGRSAGRLYELLLGPKESRGELAEFWQGTLQSLGINAGEPAERLLAHRFAVAAPSWKRLAEGIVIVKLGDNANEDRLIDEVFPPDSMETIDGNDDVLVYRTRQILSAATNGKVLILSQRQITGSLYQQVTALLMNASRRSLADDAEFARLTQALPSNVDGFAYVVPDAEQHESITSAWGFDLGTTPMVVGIRLEENGVRFTIKTRSQLWAEKGDGGPDTGRERIRQLPRTTVAAWSTRLDVQAALQQVMAKGLDEGSPAFVSTLAEMFDIESAMEDFTEGLGPRVIVAWDQHLGAGPDVPQLALLLESKDAAESARQCAEAVQVVVDWLDIQNSEPRNENRLRLSQSEFLGTTVHELSLPASAIPGGSDGKARVLPTPAFAAVGDWFVVATSGDQVRNIVDARCGLAPQLGELSDEATRPSADSGNEVFAVIQPTVAAQVVDGWLNDSRGFLSQWFGDAMGADKQRSRIPAKARLGIGTKPGEQPGTVLVGKVHSSGRAQGFLLPDDVILGVDGELLALTDSTADLRTRIALDPAAGHWTFRVRRADEWLDVVVPANAPRRISTLDPNPTAALRQLQAVCKLIDAATLRISRDASNLSTATLQLRFHATVDAH